MNLRSGLEQLKAIKHYIIAATLVFVGGIGLGAFDSESFRWMIDLQLEALQKLVEETKTQPNEQWALFWLIFMNNVRVTLQVIVSGVLFGIPPLIILIVNGILLGYVGAVQSEEHSFMKFMQGIAPHGLLELPAIIVACALGLRFGVLVSKWLIALPIASRSKAVAVQLRAFIKALIPLSLLLVGVLFIAALIESTITLWLLRG
ncbi:stage II sporulation protein M [Paenibacillus sp. YYML68]|uniref:stage II sporulation protein M n=1 Tax=Paenibacillus sp. YYML68 TaxID=2909250 RepID=UPI0024929EAA|nr:stage II sporulation protein M [Paenibacillus sp. YYML68]